MEISSLIPMLTRFHLLLALSLVTACASPVEEMDDGTVRVIAGTSRTKNMLPEVQRDAQKVCMRNGKTAAFITSWCTNAACTLRRYEFACR